MAIIRRKASEISEPTAEDMARMAAIRDEDIDYSDIPPLTDEFWANAKRFNELYRPQKRQVTVRIDADVLAWLKQDGKGYQTRLNEILRQAMLSTKSAG
ncbi:BrnA antitoxin family protein [Wielerella bovis]|uniref:BrnA antitoxin family protein n=1 Tax=Wielerella bovis TaxID=2917790 RepID=UPI0020188C76|nr:BrnA antitoxin family protein [Wielerella bovis]MCG7658068.1 BrnA antitoxin family protein [Wielerella bovis]MCG7660290.1 BrnA antitoxin family protein [Wielerella bovis]